MRKILFILCCLVFIFSSVSWAADIKITALPEDSAPGSSDIVIVVDDPGGTPVTKKATIENVVESGMSNFGISKTGGVIAVSGGQNVSVTVVNASTYDLLATDFILSVTYTASGSVTSLTLPTAQVISGRLICIKDAGGNSATYPIIVDTQGSETIDGAATITINSNYGGVWLYCDGTNWFVV